MTKIVIEVTLVGLNILVLWDYFRSRKKVEEFQKKKPTYIQGISSSNTSIPVKLEDKRSKIADGGYTSLQNNNEVKCWEQECFGDKYDHDKLRRAAEEAMRIKEQNRCEMSGNKKRVKIDRADNSLKAVLDLIDLFT